MRRSAADRTILGGFFGWAMLLLALALLVNRAGAAPFASQDRRGLAEQGLVICSTLEGIERLNLAMHELDRPTGRFLFENRVCAEVRVGLSFRVVRDVPGEKYMLVAFDEVPGIEVWILKWQTYRSVNWLGGIEL